MENLDTKLAYVSPPLGELELTVVRDARPFVQITVDLGIPNFTVFSIKFPYTPEEGRAMSELTMEAMSALLDEVTAFMLSLKFEEAVCTQIYSRVLHCFQMLSLKFPQNPEDLVDQELVQTYASEFEMPMDFVNETQDRVITASNQITRTPTYRKLELTPLLPEKNELPDAARVIRMFRNRTVNHQPRPLYLILYDQKGRQTGVLPVARFKHHLLKGKL
jgi:hypothetical protein